MNLDHINPGLWENYLSCLFSDRADSYPTHDGCYLMAQAIQKAQGGELFTMSGHYLVTGRTIDWHIVVKAGDHFFDANGRQTFEDLKKQWEFDNLRGLELRHFKEEDLATIGYDNCYSGAGNRFFEVIHGPAYDAFIWELADQLAATPEDTINQCIWPNGTVCEEFDLESFTYLSEDHALVAMPAGLDPDVFAHAYNHVVSVRAPIPDSLSPCPPF